MAGVIFHRHQSMIKNLLILLLLVPSLSFAKNICPVNTKFADDMYIPESHYNQKNAANSIDILNGLIKENKSAGEWVNVPNALNTIAGYIRKKECIDSGDLSPQSWKCFEFCLFMESSVAID